MNDAATKASLDYLTSLERCLRISWTRTGEPVFVADRVPRANVLALRGDLHDLLTGSASEASINATREFGANRVQTVGFGVAADFDQFVKLGFLYGERLVLWDLIGSRMLRKKEFSSEDLNAIGAAACNLLLLRSVVAAGGLVILPPPPMWSDFAKVVGDDLKQRTKTTSAAYGLSMALSTVEDGLRLHPYTLLDQRDRIVPHEVLAPSAEELYAKGNQDFHAALAELLSDQRLIFLQELSAKEFFRVTRRFPKLQRELGSAFSQTRPGLSKEQLRDEESKTIADITAALQKRNGAQGKYVFDGLETTAGLTTGTLVALSAGRLAIPNWLMVCTVADLSVKLVASLRKWYASPKPPVIVQAFEAIQLLSSAELEQEYDSSLRLGSIDEVIETKWQTLTGGRDIEDRHQIMMELTKEDRRVVVESLGTNEIHINVNNRTFYTDYIVDYLDDVWDSSELAFWEHIKTMCRHNDGLALSGDNFDYLERLMGPGVPSDVWLALLWTITKANTEWGGYGDLMEKVLADVVSSQTSGDLVVAELRRSQMADWYWALDPQEVNSVRATLERAFGGSIPSWLIAARVNDLTTGADS